MRGCTQQLASRGVALALVLAACGGTSAQQTTAAPTTVAPATSTTTTLAPTTTTTTPPTTTTTLAPTTTTTTLPPAVPVVGWDGEGVRDAMVAMEFDHPVWTPELLVMVREALRDIGVESVAVTDASLTFELTGTARSAQYNDLGACFTGARITGTVRLTAGEREPLTVPVEGNVPTPFLIFPSDCGEQEADAPFGEAFTEPLMAAMTGLFGAAAVPYLAEVVAEPPQGDWDLDVQVKSKAITAFLDLRSEAVPLEHVHRFLEAVVGQLYLVVPDPEFEDDATRRYRRTLLGLLLEYSDTDFGLVDDGSIAQWEAWLEGWWAARGES